MYDPPLPTSAEAATAAAGSGPRGGGDADQPWALRMLESRVSGRWAVTVAIVRIVVGAFFVLASTSKFPFSSYYEEEAAAFVEWGFPDSALIVILVGLLELGCGALLVLGLGARLAAAGLAATMVGAICTAGIQEGGYFHLGLAPAMLLVALALTWTGAGPASLDSRVAVKVGGKR
ncbi:DoxX family membrane protein [Nocardia asteroides]|nr:DoxX family membrane protein [Nocardia asteroides]